MQLKKHFIIRITDPLPLFKKGDFPTHFGSQRGGLILDSWGQISPTECVLLPGSMIRVQYMQGIVANIITPEYGKEGDIFYTDRSLIQGVHTNELRSRNERTHLKYTIDQVITRLRSQVGHIYIWGGNTPSGIHGLSGRYAQGLEGNNYRKSILRGFDCSGLLYWATDGYTPRNTSEMRKFGSGVDIAGKDISTIVQTLQPGDILVKQGHCYIILDNGESIESVASFESEKLYTDTNGVRIRKTGDVLEEVMNTKGLIPSNTWNGEASFVVRRWIR